MGSAIEILVLQALACQAQGDSPAALASLQRALTLAEPEGYVRIFVDHGAPMVELLRVAAKPRGTPAYVRRLLAAASPAARPRDDQPLIEPLSDRELEVLRLLASDLDGPHIARELSVSLPTVRTHTSNVYAKLGVTNRRAAVSRATELGLLAHREGRRPTG
jgi:LuxR family maltose regulon positive regulatory protein